MFLEPAIFTAVQTYVPASSATALSTDRLPSLLRKILPFTSTYKEDSLSRMNPDSNNLCNVLIKRDKSHITGFPLWDQYLSGSGIPSNIMQGIVRDWPMPVLMTAGPWAKRGGAVRKCRFKTWIPITPAITTISCQYVIVNKSKVSIEVTQMTKKSCSKVSVHHS